MADSLVYFAGSGGRIETLSENAGLSGYFGYLNFTIDLLGIHVIQKFKFVWVGYTNILKV